MDTDSKTQTPSPSPTSMASGVVSSRPSEGPSLATSSLSPEPPLELQPCPVLKALVLGGRGTEEALESNWPGLYRRPHTGRSELAFGSGIGLAVHTRPLSPAQVLPARVPSTTQPEASLISHVLIIPLVYSL